MTWHHAYKQIPNWPHLRQRYLAYWANQVADHAIIAHIQNPNPHPPAPEPWMVEATEEKYCRPEKLYALQQWRRTSWQWHTDLFKYNIPSYGPNVFAGFCGARPVFGAHTVWHEPIISSLDEADRVHFDENNRYWKIHLETVAYLADRYAGEQLFGITDFGGPTDWLATLMGTEAFLLESIERPDAMRALALRLAEEANHAYDLVYPIVARRQDGVVNWMPIWSDQRLGTVQDDMAINLSPRLYADVFLPAVERMADHTEHTVLHWHDGAPQHLPALLKIDAIDLIQYGHDPNSPAFREKLPDMQAIQRAGKRLFISCVQAQDAQFFIQHLDPRGLMMIINTDNNEASKQMAADVGFWTQIRMKILGISG